MGDTPPVAPVRPARLLVITAHPGDADLAIGGSVVHWVAEGAAAHLVCGTSGEAGADHVFTDPDDASIDPLELARRREAEQRRAADIIGYEAVTFLHRPDGALVNDLALREQLVRLIRTFRPDTVAGFDPRVILGEDGSVSHIDHREVGAAAIDAIHPAAANPMAFPHLVRSEGLDPHRVERLYLFGVDHAGSWIDISGTIETKLEALRVHSGQRDGLESDVRSGAGQAGQAIGAQAAEPLEVIEFG